MTTMNSNERDERVRQIQERLAAHRMEAAKYLNREWAKGDALHYYEAPDDVETLLSLLDSQAATKPVGWISCGLRQGRDDRIVDIVFENADCAKAFIDGVEPADGPIIAATRMRDKCVAELKQLLAEYKAQSLDYAPASTALGEAITKLESLTLDQVEQKQ